MYQDIVSTTEMQKLSKIVALTYLLDRKYIYQFTNLFSMQITMSIVLVDVNIIIIFKNVIFVFLIDKSHWW